MHVLAYSCRGPRTATIYELPHLNHDDMKEGSYHPTSDPFLMEHNFIFRILASTAIPHQTLNPSHDANDLTNHTNDGMLLRIINRHKYIVILINLLL